MKMNELKRNTKDTFSYILFYCPNFPERNNTSVAKEFERLITGVHQIMEASRGDETKQWFHICLQEIQKSQHYYMIGDRSNGMRFLQVADDYFDRAISRKAISTRFVAGESGPAQDTDGGFPS